MFPIPLLNVFASFLVAFVITWLAIPRIVTVVKSQKYTDKPGNRKIHKYEIPTMGGIGIFSGFFVSMMLFVNGNIEHITVLAAASMIIFLMGTKDDIVNMAAHKKLLIEFLVALLIATATDIRFSTLHGFLGINEIPVWISVLVTVFVIILIMNSFNLIDGIDGLAASAGILCSMVYGIWFWINGAVGYTVLCLALAGALSAFLPFNLYKGRFKIFMGDTGSLIIGLLMAILTIKFNEINAIAETSFRLSAAPAVSMGILFLPLYDTLRVTVIRMSQGHNPFKADNNHLHHRLLRLGLKHIKATLLLVALNIVVIALSFALNSIGILLLSLVILVFGLGFSNFTFWLEIRKARKLVANGRQGKSEEGIYYHHQSILKSNKLVEKLRA